MFQTIHEFLDLIIYEDFLVNSVNFCITSTKAIVTIPVINPRMKNINPNVVKSVPIGIIAIASIPVRKPMIKTTNPNTKKPPIKPFFTSILHDLQFIIHIITAFFKDFPRFHPL